MKLQARTSRGSQKETRPTWLGRISAPLDTRALLCIMLTSSGLFGACGGNAKESKPIGDPPAGLDWSSGTPSFLKEPGSVEPYTGTDETVLLAQSELPTGTDLHSKVVLRSCGPLSGVCHNKKEYPDMHTAYSFLKVISAPCNVQAGTLEAVFDRCERTGDRFSLDDGAELEIGWIEIVDNPNEDEYAEVDIAKDMPGLHVHLADPVGDFSEGEELTARFIRTFIRDGSVEDLSYARLTTRFYAFSEGRHVVARLAGDVSTQAQELIAVGVEQGDLNRNGVFGARPMSDGTAREPAELLARGDPERSYLIARMRGHMEGETVPGSRMPLANPPFSVAEMVAMFCFVEGLPESGEISLATPIDYKNCSYSDPATHPALSVEGVGTGWLDRVRPLLESNCGGCHSKERAEADLVLVGDSVYDSIVSKVAPGDPMGRPYVDPERPENSYLFLKLKGDDSIDGKAMPLDPLDGVRMLSETELSAIETWIRAGASP